jgi:hypothetical protein
MLKKPASFKKYFWEIKAKNLDLTKRKVYVLKRLMEYGDAKAISWAWGAFPKKDWLKALKSREISPATKGFWRSLLLDKK